MSNASWAIWRRINSNSTWTRGLNHIQVFGDVSQMCRCASRKPRESPSRVNRSWESEPDCRFGRRLIRLKRMHFLQVLTHWEYSINVKAPRNLCYWGFKCLVFFFLPTHRSTLQASRWRWRSPYDQKKKQNTHKRSILQELWWNLQGQICSRKPSILECLVFASLLNFFFFLNLNQFWIWKKSNDLIA